MCFTSAVQMVYSSPLTLPPYVFVVVAACVFRFVGLVFLFSKLIQTFALRVGLRAGVGNLLTITGCINCVLLL